MSMHDLVVFALPRQSDVEKVQSPRRYYRVAYDPDVCALSVGSKAMTRLPRRGVSVMESKGLAALFYNGRFCYACDSNIKTKREEFWRIAAMIANPGTRKKMK